MPARRAGPPRGWSRRRSCRDRRYAAWGWPGRRARRWSCPSRWRRRHGCPAGPRRSASGTPRSAPARRRRSAAGSRRRPGARPPGSWRRRGRCAAPGRLRPVPASRPTPAIPRGPGRRPARGVPFRWESLEATGPRAKPWRNHLQRRKSPGIAIPGVQRPLGLAPSATPARLADGLGQPRLPYRHRIVPNSPRYLGPPLRPLGSRADSAHRRPAAPARTWKLAVPACRHSHSL